MGKGHGDASFLLLLSLSFFSFARKAVRIVVFFYFLSSQAPWPLMAWINTTTQQGACRRPIAGKIYR